MTATTPPHRSLRQLTETQVKNAKPDLAPYKLVEPGGLFLLVQPSGTKLWRYRFTLNGTEGMLALGRYPDTTLKRVRELHQDARKLVADGINPVHHRQREKLQTDLSTFGALAASWRSVTDGRLRPATIRQRERELKNDLLPKFQNRPVASITRVELAAHLTTVEKRAPETARNLRTHLDAIFEHAIDVDLLAANPTPPRRVLATRRPKHHLSLPSERMGNFLRALDASRINPETRIAMLMVLLTACRKNEVIGAEWKEFDLQGKSWTIPATRMKAKQEHWVPLSDQAILLLTELRSRAASEHAHLFPNRVDPAKPMANRSLNAVLERLGYGGESTPHGMRAAFSTHFNKLGASVDVIEHCLAHVPVNRVRAAYNRHAYHDERRSMLQAWADHLDHQRAEQ
ncbi:tyrosine-type recombinase/integrase [Variovorax sp. ZT5P49]|uniref:tyrosine-type recombinase/integrase n=1 Tax=Variovorax sp. ZT5P49 TaxID=3443733 RepID=UPI003F48338F